MSPTVCSDHIRLAHDLQVLLETQEEADMSIVIGDPGVRFLGHSAILAARCPVIRDDILIQRKDEPFGGLIYPDVSPRIFQKLLVYIYTGRVRLGRSYILDVFMAAERFQLKSLLEKVESYLRRTTEASQVMEYLSQSLKLNLAGLSACLCRFICSNSDAVFEDELFVRASADSIKYILKHEALKSTETDIWRALLRWARYQQPRVTGSVPIHCLSEDDRTLLRTRLETFLEPGYLRFLNMDVDTVAAEIEPLELIPRSEVLKKYRHDAVSSRLASSQYAYPYPRIDFLMRSRQKTEVFESRHPHLRGITLNKEVTMPSWTTCMHIQFDEKCALGRYADLTIHLDKSYSEMHVSLQTLLATRKGATACEKGPIAITVPGRRLYFKFYAPGSFDADWGYKFQVEAV